MTFLGKVKNGVVVPDEPVDLPEGAVARIDIVQDDSGVDPEILKLRATLRKYAGCCDGLPPDYALNHDHYLYGTPKRQ